MRKTCLSRTVLYKAILEGFKDLQTLITPSKPLSHAASLRVHLSWAFNSFDIWRSVLFCSSPAHMPKLFINRRSAAEHRADPTQDPDAKHSILNQVSSRMFHFQSPPSLRSLKRALFEISVFSAVTLSMASIIGWYSRNDVGLEC